MIYTHVVIACDLCGATVKEEKGAFQGGPLPDVNAYIREWGEANWALCFECESYAEEALRKRVEELRAEGRFTGYRSYADWEKAQTFLTTYEHKEIGV